MYGCLVGAYASSIDEEGVAEKAGIKVGDIITAADDSKIKTEQSFVEKLQSIRYGQNVEIPS